KAVGALLRVVGARCAEGPGIGDGVDPVQRNARGRGDDRLHLAYRHVPVRARDVPVQLLVTVHVDEGAPHAVGDDDRLRGILRPGHPGGDPDGATETLPPRLERAHALVKHGDAVHAQGEAHAPPLVAHGNGAEDPLMASPEVDGDRLAHAQGGVGAHLEGDGEALDGKGAGLSLRPWREGGEEDDDEEKAPDTPSSRRRPSAPAARRGGAAGSTRENGTGRSRPRDWTGTPGWWC